MRTLFTDRHRDLFVVLFWIFEALFVASVVVIFRTDSPFHPEPINAYAQIIWMVSFVGLFVASFILRRSARYLANIGWLTLTGAILFAMAFPRL
jgi:cell division protein FtsW (lipid II flippase)